jgi:hypothetical protein
MYSKQKYNFITNFGEVINVDISHNYFSDRGLRFFEIIPNPETLKIIKNYGLVYKKKKSGFVILSGFEDRFKSSVFNGKINLQFKINFNDKHFLNYTDLNFDYNTKLIFKNNFKNNFLHESEYVDSSCVTENNNKFSADINLDFDESHGFFGISEDIISNELPLNYKISFNSRKIYLRYNFITNDSNMKSFYMTNGDDVVLKDEFYKRKLASGKEVFFTILDEPIQSKEFYDFRYSLKKKDDFFLSYTLPLSQPNAKNISFEKKRNVFVADIFVNID